jgi:hypothetical protein
LLCGAGWPALAGAQQPGGPGVLVLRNGNLLEGSVEEAGDYYRVNAANATFQVPADQVEMFCASVEDAYEARRRQRGGLTADSHLDLARWCLRQNLVEQARREVAEARNIDPNLLELSALDAQLRQFEAMQAARQDMAPGASQPQAPATTPTAATASVAELVATPLEISAEAQVTFVRSIQPMLVRSCATAGCHQPGSDQKLQLDRWALTGSGSATLIRRNLASVLNQVDKDDPSVSLLATRAGQLHGGPDSASRPLELHQMKLLREWLDDACDVQPPTEVLPEGMLPEAMPTAADQSFAGAALSAGKPSAVATGAFVPRDPFDAEIFNRRHDSRPVKAAAADLPPRDAAETAKALEASASLPRGRTASNVR